MFKTYHRLSAQHRRDKPFWALFIDIKKHLHADKTFTSWHVLLFPLHKTSLDKQYLCHVETSAAQISKTHFWTHISLFLVFLLAYRLSSRFDFLINEPDTEMLFRSQISRSGNVLECINIASYKNNLFSLLHHYLTFTGKWNTGDKVINIISVFVELKLL